MTKPLTESDLSEIEARCKAATPGPWTTVYEGHDTGDKMYYVVDDDPELEPLNEDVLFGNRSGENWRFIAAAREDVPILAKEIRRLWEMNHAILSGLRWTGDGYEWTGAEFDYRIKPEESAAMMLRSRRELEDEVRRLREALKECQQIAISHLQPNWSPVEDIEKVATAALEGNRVGVTSRQLVD